MEISNWAKEYVEEAERIYEAEMAKNKEKWVEELKILSKKLSAKKYRKEAKHVEKTMIPYIKRMCYYPGSYRSMVEGFEELLKFGKRQNRRIW